ncbi:unnamed protein product [Closterium sp. Yama58-4]|nr:unnamed protein product [Closterium sp. Yama58-4]
MAGGGPLDAAAGGPVPAAAGSSPAAGSPPAVAAAGSSPSAIPDGGSPPADVAPDAVPPGHLLLLKGKLKDAMDRFNNPNRKIYRFCRVYALSRDPCIFMREKRTLKGELTFAEIDDFAKVCADYVKNQSDVMMGIYWHLWEGSPFSSPAFVKCVSLWDPEFDDALPIALFPDQLLVILAAVRFKLRYPHDKAQFKRSGDPSAFSRQALVVQRWINEGPVDRDGDCVGIGSICIVGWKEIPEAEMEADELGDLT